MASSPAATPATPANVGVAVGTESPDGAMSETTGATVSLTNVLVVLTPTLPAPSICVACTVKVPCATRLTGAW